MKEAGIEWLYLMYVTQTAVLLFIAAGAISFHFRMNRLWERLDGLLTLFEKAITDKTENICELCGGPMSELSRKCAEMLRDDE